MDAIRERTSQGEASGIAEELSDKFYLGRPGAEVPWAKRGAISRAIASMLRPKGPAVLILSLARSGSSWVGSVLGSADDALYLREPITQSDPEITKRVVFDPIDHPELEPSFRRLADKAFRGLPDFKDLVVYAPEQWSLAQRRRRRVVIKEVNPRAARWLIGRYRPRVILLLRHPAAVAWSSRQKGWLGPTNQDWETRGREDGESLSRAWDALRDYPAREVVLFESLCNDPTNGFLRLYDFAGLTWNNAVAERIEENAQASRTRIDAWRIGADPEAVRALRRGYDATRPAWYRRDDEW
jgi:hypothetical protein